MTTPRKKKSTQNQVEQRILARLRRAYDELTHAAAELNQHPELSDQLEHEVYDFAKDVGRYAPDVMEAGILAVTHIGQAIYARVMELEGDIAISDVENWMTNDNDEDAAEQEQYNHDNRITNILRAIGTLDGCMGNLTDWQREEVVAVLRKMQKYSPTARQLAGNKTDIDDALMPWS